jgi:hypothetical protein
VSDESQTQRQGDVPNNSNWGHYVGMALLFVFFAFLLGLSVRKILSDKFDLGLLQQIRSAWLGALTYVLGAIYSFLFAYSFPAKHLKIAFLLLGAKYLVLIAVSYLPVATGVQHSGAIAGAVASQIAYTIILVAIAHWFKTKLQRIPLNHGISNS